MRGRGGGTRVTAVVAALALASVGLSACAILPRSGQCLDYIDLPTSTARYDEAALVVVASVTSTDRTAELSGRYTVHRALVTEVLKGHRPSGALDVVNPSDQCTTSGEPVTYLEGDDLARDGRYLLYLRAPAGGSSTWTLVVPNALDDPSVAAALPHR
ncbi:hypothetical protein [Frondihabitans peucedani]